MSVGSRADYLSIMDYWPNHGCDGWHWYLDEWNWYTYKCFQQAEELLMRLNFNINVLDNRILKLESKKPQQEGPQKSAMKKKPDKKAMKSAAVTSQLQWDKD